MNNGLLFPILIIIKEATQINPPFDTWNKLRRLEGVTSVEGKQFKPTSSQQLIHIQ